MRIRPHQLSNEELPDGDYVVHIENGVVSWAAATPPAPSDPLITVVAGVPSNVWDSDGQLVYVEG